MDLDRPHFPTSSASTDLFICFSSRLSSSSSSMKLSKSILSPARAARDPVPVSLSSSLSRRLRTNGTLKSGQGQASPFITTPGKKRGCDAFDNPEPSSPKVTCIGQVRVKTKKKVKQQRRSLSRRRNGGGELSIRKIQVSADEDKSCPNLLQQQRLNSNGGSGHYQECLAPHRNQRWVHLPVSVCEAVRSFGAEFSCLFPCKSGGGNSCFSTGERDEDFSKGEKAREKCINNGGCGAVFARWLVSVNDGEGGKKREIELVVGGGDDEEETRRISMRRRHVFDNIEVKDDRVEMNGAAVGVEEAGRVSICIPPKNALLLMRCRSDPMKMAALANNKSTWDDAYSVVDDGKIDNDVDEEITLREETVEEVIEEDATVVTAEGEGSILEMEVGGEEEATQQITVEEQLGIHTLELVGEEEEEEEVESNMSSFEALLDQEIAETYNDCSNLQLQQDEQHPAEEDAEIQSNQAEDEVQFQINQPAPPFEEQEEEEEEAAAAPIENENEATTAKETVNNHEENQSNPQFNDEKSEREEVETPIHRKEEEEEEEEELKKSEMDQV